LSRRSLWAVVTDHARQGDATWYSIAMTELRREPELMM
jgi:hypothetical protein